MLARATIWPALPTITLAYHCGNSTHPRPAYSRKHQSTPDLDTQAGKAGQLLSKNQKSLWNQPSRALQGPNRRTHATAAAAAGVCPNVGRVPAQHGERAPPGNASNMHSKMACPRSHVLCAQQHSWARQPPWPAPAPRLPSGMPSLKPAAPLVGANKRYHKRMSNARSAAQPLQYYRAQCKTAPGPRHHITPYHPWRQR